jgi:beta-lactam-binding protein with PASTA domain
VTFAPSVMKPLRRAARSHAAAMRARAPDRRRTVAVPRIVGLPFDRALRVVKRAGLRQTEPGFNGSTSNPHLSGQVDRVVSQSPPPGAQVARGSTIVIHEAVQVRRAR